MGVGKEQVVCNLKTARKSKKLSQSELAERVGVKRQAIYDMESGRYVPNTTVALRMARELGCKVEDLFALDEPVDEQPVTLVEKTGDRRHQGLLGQDTRAPHRLSFGRQVVAK